MNVDECHIYIESTLSWPKKGDGIVGIIFTDYEDEHTKQLFGVVKNSTAHEAALIGIKTALKYVGNYKIVNLHLSCAYAAESFKYIPSWKDSGWINSRGNPVKYNELWKEIDNSLQEKELKIHYNEVNGYRRWLKNECDNRGRKHGFIL